MKNLLIVLLLFVNITLFAQFDTKEYKTCYPASGIVIDFYSCNAEIEVVDFALDCVSIEEIANVLGGAGYSVHFLAERPAISVSLSFPCSTSEFCSNVYTLLNRAGIVERVLIYRRKLQQERIKKMLP